jgi:hypothetical protein
MKITEKIKSFEDACEHLGLNPENLPNVEHLPEEDGQSIVAHYKLIIIIRALNEGWEPDFKDHDQWKYWNYLWINAAGFVCSGTDYSPSHTHVNIGSRLCFKSHEIAQYAIVQFKGLYEQYLLK